MKTPQVGLRCGSVMESLGSCKLAPLCLVLLGGFYLLGGCAQKVARVEIRSVPQYAEVYRRDGTRLGQCPVQLNYSLNDADRTRGYVTPNDLMIRWHSGAATWLRDWKVRILGSDMIDIVTVERPKNVPGAQADLEYAMQVDAEKRASAERQAAEEESSDESSNSEDSDSDSNHDGAVSSDDQSTNQDTNSDSGSNGDFGGRDDSGGSSFGANMNWAGVRQVQRACDSAFLSSEDEDACLVAVKAAAYNPARAIKACDQAFLGSRQTLSCIRYAGTSVVDPSNAIKACDDAFLGAERTLTCVRSVRYKDFDMTPAIKACDDAFLGDNQRRCVVLAGRAQVDPTSIIKTCAERHSGVDALGCIGRLIR